MTTINDFTIVREEIKGDITVSQSFQYNNIDADTVIIEENVTARFFGKINKRLILKKGSKLYLLGAIYGKVENYGGELHICAN